MRKMEAISCLQNNRQHQYLHRSILVRILAWLLYAFLILSARAAFMKVYLVSSLSSRSLARLSLAVRISNHCWNCLKFPEQRLNHAGQQVSITWPFSFQRDQTLDAR